jgi:hypothetical protein
MPSRPDPRQWFRPCRQPLRALASRPLAAAAIASAFALACVAVALAGRPAASVGPSSRVPVRSIVQGAAARVELVSASEALARGRRKLEQARMAPGNLYQAWAAFGEAQRSLARMDPRSSAAYDEAVQLGREAERELARRCARLLFAAARFGRYGEAERAQRAYRAALVHFPGDDPSGCRSTALASIAAGPAER